MSRVISRDGTPISFERAGEGAAVVLVGGALVDPATGRAGRAENEPLAAELAGRFAVYNYDRRGRGESGDTQPYARERELEDLEALIREAGGSASLYGVSSGGALAIEAAAARLPIEKLAVYEVPYFLGDAVPAWRQYVRDLDEILAAGRRGDAVELFMRMAGSSDEGIAAARRSSLWPDLEAVAHTLAYDAACIDEDGFPAARLGSIDQPTLVLSGGGNPFFEAAADAIAAAVPAARRRTVAGQGHLADPAAIGRELASFL